MDVEYLFTFKKFVTYICKNTIIFADVFKIINKFSDIMVKRMRLFIAAVMLVMAATVNAQITTSAMAGQVTGTEGEDIIGATIRVTHEPSGTTYNAVTNTDGRWAIQGMRVGGPYTVKISYIGYAEKDYRGISLALGETYNLNATMSEDVNELGEIVVVGSASKFAAEKTGATTNISNAQIQALPTVNRSIEDIARISPYANGMSLGGGDGRSTNFTLDGANLNNNFGLNDGLPGGGNPISMDAIDEVQVVVAPYDVRQTNFIGGGINAVTKSGTNTFKGTAYVYHQNENMHGNRVANQDLGERGTDRMTTYGFTLGGPILKDKLFFFANAEYSKIPTVANRWRASEDGVGDAENYISRTTVADMEKVRNFLIDKYGYDPGSYTSFPADEDNLKLLARIDWNITNNHHLAVRYNYTKNTAWNATNGNSSDTGSRLNNMNRFSQYSMAFSNSMYSQNNSVSTISADLNSRFGNNISNQLLFTYTDIDEKRGSDSAPFPFVDIMNGYDASTNMQTLEPYMSFGYELFTHNNRVQNKILTLNDNFTYYLGDHKLMAGFKFEHQMANNSYMRNGTGYYRYRSLDDFLNGAAPETVALSYGYNGETNPAAEVKFNQYGWYVQDEWNALPNLMITGGIRFDLLSFDSDDLMRNNAIYNLDFGGRHIDTGRWPGSNVQISPRLGFTWDVFGDKRLKVRGGTGLFAGRLPLVFFTNMPTNSGMVQNLVNAVTSYDPNVTGLVTGRDPLLDKFKGGLVTNVDQIRELLGAPETITPEEGTLPTKIAGVDPDFKMPQVWKSSIAVDYQFPVSFPLTLTGEFTYIRKINDVMIDNYNFKPVGDDAKRLQGADNRVIYDASSLYYRTTKDNANPDAPFVGSGASVLTNTSRGHGWTLNFTATAEPVKDLHLMAAYTHTVMKEVSGMPGNDPYSTWLGNLTVNGANTGEVHNSEYVIPDRVIASASYKYHNDNFSLFYTGYRPSGYSYTYYGDLNGDGISGNDLMYIPRNDSEINFTNDADRQLFWDFVNQDDYLKSHKGEYADSYSVYAPWVHRFDFRWTHDFNLKVGNTHHTLQLSLDIMNVGNLFNSKWGVEKNMSSCNNGQILKVDRVDNGTPYFSMFRGKDGDLPVATNTWSFNRNYNQCWKMQIGVKYYFN